MKPQIEYLVPHLHSRIRWHSTPGSTAFTLIEMLVVISIIGILAALIIPTARIASAKKTLSTVEAELHQLEVPIEHYKEKLGYFPPDNTNNPAQPPLYYELGGTVSDHGSTVFRPLAGGAPIAASSMRTNFNLGSFMNSSPTEDDVKNFHTHIKASQAATNSVGVIFFIVPAQGPSDPKNPYQIISGKPAGLNTWRYDSSSTNRHNLEGYDLWAEILLGGKTNIIGNWKR